MHRRDVNNQPEEGNLSLKYISHIGGHERAQARIPVGLSALPHAFRTQESGDLIARTLPDKPRRCTLIDRHLINPTHARLRAASTRTASILRDRN